MINITYSQTGEATKVTENILVCKLTGPEQAIRKEALRKEIFSQVSEIKEISDGYIFDFTYSDDLYLKATDYIIAEKNCCPFFQFDFSIPTKSKNFTLKISGESEAKEMLKMFVEEIKKF